MSTPPLPPPFFPPLPKKGEKPILRRATNTYLPLSKRSFSLDPEIPNKDEIPLKSRRSQSRREKLNGKSAPHVSSPHLLPQCPRARQQSPRSRYQSVNSIESGYLVHLAMRVSMRSVAVTTTNSQVRPRDSCLQRAIALRSRKVEQGRGRRCSDTTPWTPLRECRVNENIRGVLSHGVFVRIRSRDYLFLPLSLVRPVGISSAISGRS